MSQLTGRVSLAVAVLVVNTINGVLTGVAEAGDALFGRTVYHGDNFFDMIDRVKDAWIPSKKRREHE